MSRHIRPFTGGQFALELDGSAVGFLTSVDGGHFKSDEVKSPEGRHHTLVTKYPSKPKFEDITFQVGMATSPTFWDWIKSSFQDKPQRRNGAIVIYDFKHRERQRRTFYNAIVSEVGFPGLDAASKTPAQLTVKISPERLKFEDPEGTRGGVSYAQNELQKQKMWLCNNFALSLERFKGDESLRNAKIESFTFKTAIMANPIGRMLETHKYAGKVELPSLQVSFPQANVKPWMEWYEKCVTEGDYIGELTTGSITYYASDQKTVLMTLHLDNVGITSIEFDKLEAHKESVAKVKASLYVESYKLETADGTI